MSTHFWDEDPRGPWTLGLENKGYYFNTGESDTQAGASGPGPAWDPPLQRGPGSPWDTERVFRRIVDASYRRPVGVRPGGHRRLGLRGGAGRPGRGARRADQVPTACPPLRRAPRDPRPGTLYRYTLLLYGTAEDMTARPPGPQVTSSACVQRDTEGPCQGECLARHGLLAGGRGSSGQCACAARGGRAYGSAGPGLTPQRTCAPRRTPRPRPRPGPPPPLLLPAQVLRPHPAASDRSARPLPPCASARAAAPPATPASAAPRSPALPAPPRPPHWTSVAAPAQDPSLPAASPSPPQSPTPAATAAEPGPWYWPRWPWPSGAPHSAASSL